jgi:NAD(P) transhydrogenase
VDREIVSHLVTMFTTLGMSLHLAVEAKNIEILPTGVRVELTSGKILEAECCLVAQGRQGNTEQLQLQNAGLEADARGLLKVSPSFQTSVPNIYALGDVIGFPALASTAMGQGRLAACSAFELTDQCEMPGVYPYGIYTIPEISTIGKTEEELKAQGIPFFKGVAEYREIARGQIVGDQWGVLKILVHRETRHLLGVHILGDSAADLIHIGQAVMALGGTLDYFITTVFNYPTLAEAYKTAALNAQNVYLGRV